MNTDLLDRWDAVRDRVHRRRRWIRAVAALILVPWLGRFAYLRISTPPADTTRLGALYEDPSLGAPPPVADHPVRELVSAIGALPPLPGIPAPPTAPAGLAWRMTERAALANPGSVSLDPLEALLGDWQPDQRLHLQQIILYLDNPATRDVLDQVVEIAVRPQEWPSLAQRHLDYGRLRQAARMLTVRARYRIAKRGLSAACRDLEAVLQLADKLESDGTVIDHLVSIAGRALVQEEIIGWSRELELTRDQAGTLTRLLRKYHRPLPDRWRRMLEGETRLNDLLYNAAYTCDADGDGWFVPVWATSDGAGMQAMRVLNVLSPAMNDRRTIWAHRRYSLDRAVEASRMPFPEARRKLVADKGNRLLPNNAVDSPFTIISDVFSSLDRLHEHLTRDESMQAAAIVSVALSAYRTEQGRYPLRLEDLVPEYLAVLPADPVTGQPLRYRLDDRDGYSLYSIGENGTDEGGKLRDPQGNLLKERYGDDWIYRTFRGEPVYEWYLEPAAPAQPGNSSGNSQTQPGE